MTPNPPIDFPAPPRRLRRRPGQGCSKIASLWFLRLFIMPHTIVGIFLICSAFFGLFVYVFGTDAPGRITSLETSRGKKGPNYYVRYAYTVAGADYPGSISVTSEVFGKLQVGQAFPVRVFTPTPTWTPLPRGPGSSDSSVLFYPFFALFWNGILCIFLWMAWIAPWRLRSLLRQGLATAGVIIDKSTRSGNKGAIIYSVRYSYEATLADDFYINGPETFERDMTVTRADYNSAEVGLPVTVIYYPKKPKRSLVYEFAEYEVVP
jgi:hypothetical protein